MNKEKKNRKLLIDTLAGAFKKVTKDRLPQHVDPSFVSEVLPEVFDDDFFLLSNQRLGHVVDALKKKADLKDDNFNRYINKIEILSALWWSITANANPYKIDVATMLFWDNSQKQTFQAIDKILTPVANLLAHLEKDRASLSALGAW
tara:strand:- start:188 stop:628 length:441 start_codon:yes stop_codon:yes gene_type:complete